MLPSPKEEPLTQAGLDEAKNHEMIPTTPTSGHQGFQKASQLLTRHLITDEQRSRSERNRLEALKKKAKRDEEEAAAQIRRQQVLDIVFA